MTSKAMFIFSVLAAVSNPASAATNGTGNQALAAHVLAAQGADAASWMAKNGGPAHDKLMTMLKHVLPNVSDDAASGAVDTEIQYEASAFYQENVKLYAAHFSDAELNDLLTFYRSAGGRAWLAQSPLIVQERTANARQISIDVVRRMVNSACKGATVCN